MRRLFSQLIILYMLPLLSWGVENFPPPEFTTGYQFPGSTHPGPRAELFLLLDVAMLVLALALASYFALKLRSRRHLLILTIFSVLYFGFYRHGCVCSVGSLQNVAMAIWQPGYALTTAIAAFFLLPLLFALFAGRAFCAGVCPLGAIQDLVLHRQVKVPAWLEHPLGLLPYLYLGAAVLFAATGSVFVICQYDPFIAFFRLNGSLFMLITGGILLLIAVFVGRPYCRFLCPYSVLLRLLAPLTKWRTVITRQECVQCHLCADACPFGAIQPPTPPQQAHQRFEGRSRLAMTLMLLPVLILLGGWLGSRSSGTLYRMNPVVQRANAAMVQDREHLPIDPASPNVELYRQAIAIRKQFDVGSPLFGGWIGLVIGMKLVFLSIRRHRKDYEIDQAACLTCGRCYQVCPLERAEVPDVVKSPIGVAK